MRPIALLCFAMAVFAQTPPQLEVASIKPSNAAASAASGIGTGQGRIDAHNVTLKRLIIGAYRVGPNEISGGPGWLNEDRFDILAKAEQTTDSDAALMEMLQTLLADRFKLKLHRETRTMTAYVLDVTKTGPRIEKAEAGAEGNTNTNSSNGRVAINARSITMDRLANALAREVDLPVINRTGLDGSFNFELHLDARAVPAIESSRRRLDLHSDSGTTRPAPALGKVPVEVIVVDSAEKPSPN